MKMVSLVLHSSPVFSSCPYFPDERKSWILVGCRECVHHASNTFAIDEALGCARVKVQYGDDETEIQVSATQAQHWLEETLKNT